MNYGGPKVNEKIRQDFKTNIVNTFQNNKLGENLAYFRKEPIEFYKL